MNRFKKNIAFLFVLISFCGCKNTSDLEIWDKISRDSKIRKNNIYKKLDKQIEIQFPDIDKLSKKSSDVSYYTGKTINFKNEYSKNYTCKAYFLLSDTLTINIGIQNPFASHGFKINIKDNKFYIKTYKTSDVINEFETLPTYKIVYQKLTLDKTSYKTGDSLFGRVEFKSIETDPDKNQIQHFGKGYFRTKIKEL